jgi:hypothetical protein
MADRIAIDNARMNKGVADLADGYGDWKNAIEDGPTSPKYQSSVKGLEKAV